MRNIEGQLNGLVQRVCLLEDALPHMQSAISENLVQQLLLKQESNEILQKFKSLVTSIRA